MQPREGNYALVACQLPLGVAAAWTDQEPILLGAPSSGWSLSRWREHRDAERAAPQDTDTPGRGEPGPAAAWRWCPWPTGEASPLGQDKDSAPRTTQHRPSRPPALRGCISPTASPPLVAMTTTAATEEAGRVAPKEARACAASQEVPSARQLPPPEQRPERKRWAQGCWRLA